MLPPACNTMLTGVIEIMALAPTWSVIVESVEIRAPNADKLIVVGPGVGTGALGPA